MREKIGLVAGSGKLPVLAAAGIRSAGYQPAIVGLAEEMRPETRAELPGMTEFSLGRLGAIIEHFSGQNIRRVVFAGKVHKLHMYTVEMDPIIRSLLSNLQSRNDDSILGAVVDCFAGAGIQVLPQAEFLRDLLLGTGLLTRRAPDARERADIVFGLAMAKQIGALDFGQSVVVKDRFVLAVEAVEGTDETIRRGARLAGGGAVVVKVSKPQQDPRFDVPTVGLGTIAAMTEAGASTLAVEAERTFFVDLRACLERADKAGLAVVAIGSNGEY